MENDVEAICMDFKDESEKKVVRDFYPKIQEIKKIAGKYLALMTACVFLPTLRDQIEENPKKVICDWIKEIRIPDDTSVILDPTAAHWPILYLRDKKTNIQYKCEEFSDLVEMTKVFDGNDEVNDNKPNSSVQKIVSHKYYNKETNYEIVAESKESGDSNKLDYIKHHQNEDCSVQIDVPLPGDCEKILVLPYFSFVTDLKTTFTFNGKTDENTIVLSCCS